MYASHSQLLPSVVIFASLGIVQASLTLPSLIAKILNSQFSTLNSYVGSPHEFCFEGVEE